MRRVVGESKHGGSAEVGREARVMLWLMEQRVAGGTGSDGWAAAEVDKRQARSAVGVTCWDWNSCRYSLLNATCRGVEGEVWGRGEAAIPGGH